jgi:hypothetical protein
MLISAPVWWVCFEREIEKRGGARIIREGERKRERKRGRERNKRENEGDKNGAEISLHPSKS